MKPRKPYHRLLLEQTHQMHYLCCIPIFWNHSKHLDSRIFHYLYHSRSYHKQCQENKLSMMMNDTILNHQYKHLNNTISHPPSQNRYYYQKPQGMKIPLHQFQSSKLNFLYLNNSNIPQPRGKASAVTNAALEPRESSPLNFIRMTEGIIILTERSIIGRGL